MHACGHDMHVTWLAGATAWFARSLSEWRGTLILAFQPAEEIGKGARAMIEDGLSTKFAKPDIILGQHVMVGSAGDVGWREGVVTSAADSFQIHLFGRGAHGSMPQASIDPVVMAASIVLRLQTIVSREIAATESAVVTVGALQAGTKENIIPDEAIIKLNVRTFDARVRQRVLAAIERIVNAEATASGAQKMPEITLLDRYSLVTNEPESTKKVVKAFRGHFDEERVREVQPTSASEDFGSFGEAWHAPSVFWFIGGTDPQTYAKSKEAGRLGELPSNHNPRFAPVMHPTLETGIEAMIVAARSWLAI
jgi:amidohydrolase